MKLSPRKKYLQIAFNRELGDVELMIRRLPPSEMIIIEAGTPFVKNYGEYGISRLAALWESIIGEKYYLVADLKCMDRGFTEVEMAQQAGASAATCLGLAPVETIDQFIIQCRQLGIDSMVDMMNVEFPFEVLQKLKKMPDVVVLHRGVDERIINREKSIPYNEIERIKGAYDVLISIAGGETTKEVSRTFFNGADIAVVWQAFFDDPTKTKEIAAQFLEPLEKRYGKK